MVAPRFAPPGARHGRRPGFLAAAAMAAAMVIGLAASAPAQTCPEEPTLQNFTGGGQVVCPCFVPGEEAGAVFTVPAEHYPIQVLRVGIGWASQFGGSPQSLEQAIHVYGAGLPNPGARLGSLPGPVLTDGAINEFNLEAQLGGGVTVPSGPFAVTLEFLNSNSGNLFAPSVVHDGNGCQFGKNVIKANPGGWLDSCGQGLTGDWIFYLVYRRVDCSPTGIGDERIVSARPVFLMAPSPNPLQSNTSLSFVLEEPGFTTLRVFDLAGREVASILERELGAGAHEVSWDGRGATGDRLPSGIYLVSLDANGVRSAHKLVMAR